MLRKWSKRGRSQLLLLDFRFVEPHHFGQPRDQDLPVVELLALEQVIVVDTELGPEAGNMERTSDRPPNNPPKNTKTKTVTTDSVGTQEERGNHQPTPLSKAQSRLNRSNPTMYRANVHCRETRDGCHRRPVRNSVAAEIQVGHARKVLKPQWRTQQRRKHANQQKQREA